MISMNEGAAAAGAAVLAEAMEAAMLASLHAQHESLG